MGDWVVVVVVVGLVVVGYVIVVVGRSVVVVVVVVVVVGVGVVSYSRWFGRALNLNNCRRGVVLSCCGAWKITVGTGGGSRDSTL